MKYSLRQLEVFVAIGRHESVSRAAEALSLSQSATSMALAELEKQFDTRLFDRHGKRLQLNERGRQILPQAIELLDRAEQLESMLAGDSGLGSLRIGATLTVGNYLATMLIGEYMQRHPGTRVKLEVHNTAMVVEQVAHLKLDFGLIEGDSQHPDLEISPWVDDELVIFAAPDHPLARCKQISLEDVTKEAWILREAGSGTRQVFNAAFRHVLHKLDIRLELEHTEAIKRAVEAGMGISCISRLALMDAFRRGSLVPLEIPGLDLKRQFNFVLHRQKFRTAGIEAFLSLCREVAQGAARSDEIVMKRPDGRRLEFR
ncbi:MAG: LysR family transcriptional regulator [Cellvibrio sp.]|jgi:DNA-binding transcriptional LysR family regulator